MSMATRVDATASVDPRAELGHEVEIGPFCVVGPDVAIGRGTRLVSHVTLMGAVSVGEHNVLGRFCAIGCEPQDASYRGAATRVELGDHNDVRENVTISRGTEKEDGATRIGDRNVLANGSHVAHDCRLGDGVRLGAKVLLAGHVRVESHATLGEGAVALQFVTVGGYSRALSLAKVGRDLPPYMMARGNPAEVCGLNAGALRGHDLAAVDVSALRVAYRLIYRDRVELGRAEEMLLALEGLTPAVLRLFEFLRSQRGGRNGRARGH